jgi:2-polyprenyl-3-methyl-5-hydroxy-6-metoxy-1,4-benzoquinol methylase
MSRADNFSKNYFDGDQQITGAYSSYDEERLWPAFEDMVRKFKNMMPPKRILDIGCAKGFLVSALRMVGYNAMGIDISEYAVGQANDYVKPFLQTAELGKEDLPYDNNSFDVIICMGTLEYVPDQDFAVSEINRILKPGGTLLITTLESAPANDRYRVYAKARSYWDAVFNANGYTFCHDLARKVFTVYVRQIVKYDLVRFFRPEAGQRRKLSMKAKLVKLLYHAGFASLLENYLYNRQMRSGYSMLGYQKKYSG